MSEKQGQRPLPDSFTPTKNTTRERDPSAVRRSRALTNQKRQLFREALDMLHEEHDAQVLRDIGIDDVHLWRTCAVRRFKGMEGEALKERMLVSMRFEVLRRRTLTRSAPPQAPPPIRTPMVRADQVRVLGPMQDEDVQRIINMVRTASTTIPMDPTPEEVERIFLSKGLGESGRRCNVCEENRGKFVRFSKKCKHEMCSVCCDQWIRPNTTVNGARCPGCLAERSSSSSDAQPPPEPNIVDPHVLFGGSVDGSDRNRVVFSSMQVPHLQAELDSSGEQGERRAHRCPSCMTVSNTWTSIRRCLNPSCAMEFCTKCDSEVCLDSGDMHTSGRCVPVVEETRSILEGEGLTQCGRCGTPIFHAVHHGCHHIRCPNCAHEMCHSCGRPFKHPDCKCPLFCRGDFECRCATKCPECQSGTKCTHCDGLCGSCLANRYRS